MGKGRARLVAAVRRAAPVLGGTVMLAAAAGALAAGASAGTHGSAAARPQLVVDTRGARGLDAPLTPFAAGDVEQRVISLRTHGGMPVAAAALVIVAPGATSALRHRGFEVRVDRCSRGWSPSPGGGLRCAGHVRAVLGWRAAEGRLETRAIGRIRAGGTAFLRVSLRLPAGAATDQEGRSVRLRYRFTAA